jgi:hypothetical protein
MNIVYIILAHNNPDQLVRLVKRLQSPDVTILIHLDKKMDASSVKQITSKLNSFKNVHFLPRYFVRWGGFSMSRATNMAISQVISQKYPCDYAILLSGQDYPIKTHSGLIQFLENNPGKSFLEFRRLPTENWQDGGLPRIQKWHFGFSWITNNFLRNKLKHLLELLFNKFFPSRQFPTGFQPYGGSSWWGFNRDCLEYLNSFNHTHSAFIRFFTYVGHANELYYQTVLLNSPLASEIENWKFTYTDWSVKAPNPKTLLVEDYDQLVKSDKFFARKFNAKIDSQILDMLDDLCLETTSS